MTTKLYQNGLGGTLGDQVDTCKPLWTSGNVWYVSFAIGIDAASPAGQNRERPLKTAAQAITNATDGDIIVFLAGHTETFTATQGIGHQVTLVGEGTASGKPSVSFVNNSPSTALFTCSSSNIEFRNIYFPPQSQSCGVTKINFTAPQCRVRGCYFELNGNDTARVILLGGDRLRISSTTFISTSTTIATQPAAAILASTNVNDFEIENSVFSGGAVGFSTYAMDLSFFTVLRCKFLGLSLLLGADIRMGASATGFVNPQTVTGGSRVDWT